MNLTRFAVLGLLASLTIPLPVEAQAPQVTRTRNLRFRTVLAGYPETVTRLNRRCGRVSVRGQRNAEILVQWTLPSSIQHTTQGDQMPISFGPDDAGYGPRNNLNTMTGWDPATSLVTRLNANNGRKHFALGGTVSPAPNQRVGRYRGPVVLTITYTGN